MQIRPARREDLPAMEAIYEQAKEFMRETGNPNQWNGSYPEEGLLLCDMEHGNSYIVEENGQVIGTFAFIKGEDPTYRVIEDGMWMKEEPYGTVHRLASATGTHGVAAACFAWCRMQCENGSGIAGLRADTHADNRVMQHVLEKNGFVRCGIIHLENGDPRIAYQYVRPEQMNSGMVQKDQNPAEQRQPVRQQSGEQDDGMPVVEKMQSEPDRGFGIASLVLGIISLVFFFATLNIPLAVLAIALGVVQLGKKQPKGMAIAGIITGDLAIFFTVLMWLLIFLFHSASGSVQSESYSPYDYGYYDQYDGYGYDGGSRYYGQAPNGISQEYYQGYLDGYYDAYSSYRQ